MRMAGIIVTCIIFASIELLEFKPNSLIYFQKTWAFTTKRFSCRCYCFDNEYERVCVIFLDQKSQPYDGQS